MIRTFITTGCLVFVMGCGNSVAAADPEISEHGLQIELRGVRGTEGSVIVAVYDTAQAFERNRDAIAWVSTPASSKTIALSDFPEGAIAVTAFHDTNWNGKYDMEGETPLEGWGNSGDVSRWSEPTFEDALAQPGVVVVQMHYYQ